jgi:hypothetical protein
MPEIAVATSKTDLVRAVTGWYDTGEGGPLYCWGWITPGTPEDGVWLLRVTNPEHIHLALPYYEVGDEPVAVPQASLLTDVVTAGGWDTIEVEGVTFYRKQLTLA